MGIHTSLDEIIGFLTKLKDADPADCHHASLDATKKQDVFKQDIVIVTILTDLPQGEAEEKEEVVSLTATIVTNLRQGEAVVKEEAVSLTATIVTNLRQGEAEEKDKVAMETESNEALSE